MNTMMEEINQDLGYNTKDYTFNTQHVIGYFLATMILVQFEFVIIYNFANYLKKINNE